MSAVCKQGEKGKLRKVHFSEEFLEAFDFPRLHFIILTQFHSEFHPGRNYIPPPSPHFWPNGIFQRRGVGVYILSPHAAGILYAPPFYTPPTHGRVFSGVGGWGCIKFGNSSPGPFLSSIRSQFLLEAFFSYCGVTT